MAVAIYTTTIPLLKVVRQSCTPVVPLVSGMVMFSRTEMLGQVILSTYNVRKNCLTAGDPPRAHSGHTLLHRPPSCWGGSWLPLPKIPTAHSQPFGCRKGPYHFPGSSDAYVPCTFRHQCQLS